MNAMCDDTGDRGHHKADIFLCIELIMFLCRIHSLFLWGADYVKPVRRLRGEKKQVKKQIGGAVKPGVWKSKIWRKIEGHDLDCSQRIIHTRLCLALVQHIAGEHLLLEPQFMVHSRSLLIIVYLVMH